MDIVLRNNRTTDEYPLGIFHPQAEWHHIKKENIDLIEDMDLAVLPRRLWDELAAIAGQLTGVKTAEFDISLHSDWIDGLLNCYGEQNTTGKRGKSYAKKCGMCLCRYCAIEGCLIDTDTGRAQFAQLMTELGAISYS